MDKTIDCGSVTSLVGRWTYRSFISNPDISKDFNGLEFGRAELMVEMFQPDLFIGRLSFGDAYQFRLEGSVSPTAPVLIRFTGVGDKADSKDQVYDYFGCLAPTWIFGINQRPTIVGSVLRTVPHDGGRAAAGVVASFIALKQ